MNDWGQWHHNCHYSKAGLPDLVANNKQTKIETETFAGKNIGLFSVESIKKASVPQSSHFTASHMPFYYIFNEKCMYINPQLEE